MIKNFKSKVLVIILAVFSILFNQYYGYVGILPIDSFLIFNSGYDLMNGYYPFKDYWTIKEPFIDLLQAIFFQNFWCILVFIRLSCLGIQLYNCCFYFFYFKKV